MSGGFLLLRRDGATWALPHPAVRGLARCGGGFEVRLDGGTLAADELLGVAAELLCHPAGAVLRRFWPEAAHGLAVHGGRPLVLIDPAAPPRALRSLRTPRTPGALGTPRTPRAEPAGDGAAEGPTVPRRGPSGEEVREHGA
jgi:hypothetical protein